MYKYLLVDEVVIIGFKWLPVKKDVSVLRLIQSLQQTHTCAFSFSRRTDKSCHLTWLQIQGKVLKYYLKVYLQ